MDAVGGDSNNQTFLWEALPSMPTAFILGLHIYMCITLYCYVYASVVFC